MGAAREPLVPMSRLPAHGPPSPPLPLVPQNPAAPARSFCWRRPRLGGHFVVLGSRAHRLCCGTGLVGRRAGLHQGQFHLNTIQGTPRGRMKPAPESANSPGPSCVAGSWHSAGLWRRITCLPALGYLSPEVLDGKRWASSAPGSPKGCPWALALCLHPRGAWCRIPGAAPRPRLRPAWARSAAWTDPSPSVPNLGQGCMKEASLGAQEGAAPRNPYSWAAQTYYQEALVGSPTPTADNRPGRHKASLGVDAESSLQIGGWREVCRGSGGWRWPLKAPQAAQARCPQLPLHTQVRCPQLPPHVVPACPAA
ncbi:uncharacterized protein LOC134761216 [Pongo abelii]|uniref:uncharacterized protein LOC134761216 n=1 Tax=Pongo abelii TaxID=9601 RepID=UPI0030073FEF